MLVLQKNDTRMTTDFQAKVVMYALLLRLKKKVVLGSSFNQPKTDKGQLHKIHVDLSTYPKNILHFNNQLL